MQLTPSGARGRVTPISDPSDPTWGSSPDWQPARSAAARITLCRFFMVSLTSRKAPKHPGCHGMRAAEATISGSPAWTRRHRVVTGQCQAASVERGWHVGDGRAGLVETEEARREGYFLQ